MIRFFVVTLAMAGFLSTPAFADKAGTPVMFENRLAGLYLPLKVLVYQSAEGKIWVAYDNVADQPEGLDGLDDDTEMLTSLGNALDKMGRAAAGQ